ncbi:hypothetical protein EJ110_NYTH57111 [Nymphaea thermarum]|nr:hypothetical protein EJ110_NYTH57111 [Nymphaea thermarum]
MGKRFSVLPEFLDFHGLKKKVVAAQTPDCFQVPAHVAPVSSTAHTAPGLLRLPNTSEMGQEQRTSLTSATPLFQPPISASVAFGSFGSPMPTNRVLRAALLKSTPVGMNSGTIPGHSNNRPDGHVAPTRVAHAAMNFDGAVIRWYRWLVAQHGQPDWTTLVTAMAARFGPSAYVDYNIELSKIQQKWSVVEYQERFEELSNMTRGWPMDALICAFVGGLKEEIRLEEQSM